MRIDIDLTNRLDNIIFPLGKARYVKNNGKDFCTDFEFFGTAFFIGSESYGLTCSHVINDIYQSIEGEEKIGYIAGTFKNNFNHKLICALAMENNKPVFENHPEQDVSIFKLAIDQDTEIYPLFIIEENFRLPAADYYSVGYPSYLKFDNMSNKLRDELNVITKGYIRRLVKYNIPKFKGNNFIELSEIGTAGYSGAPIVSQREQKNKISMKQISFHRLLGIYIGQVVTEIDEEKIYLGYGINVESFADWKPNMLNGKSIKDIMTPDHYK